MKSDYFVPIALAALLAQLPLAAAPPLLTDGAPSTAVLQTLARVSRLELPPRAARLVIQTPLGQRGAMSVAIVRHVGEKYPNPAVVASVARAMLKVAPEVAPALSAYVVRSAPSLSDEIAQATVTTAPSAADKSAGSLKTPTAKTQVAATSPNNNGNGKGGGVSNNHGDDFTKGNGDGQGKGKGNGRGQGDENGHGNNYAQP